MSDSYTENNGASPMSENMGESGNAMNRLGAALGGINLGVAAAEEEGAAADAAEGFPELEPEPLMAAAAAAPAKPKSVKKSAAAAAPAAASSLGSRKATTVQADVAADIARKLDASSLSLETKQREMLLKIPTEIRAPLASLYQKDPKKYEKLAANYVAKIGTYLKRNGKKPTVEEQREMLGIQVSELTAKRKAAAVAAPAAAAPSLKSRRAARNAVLNSNSNSAKTARTAASKKPTASKKPAAAAAAPKPAVTHGAQLTAALGYDAPKFFIEKYLKALDARGGSTKKLPHEKFVKYCGVFAERKTRKNKGTARSRPASVAASAPASASASAPASNVSI